MTAQTERRQEKWQPTPEIYDISGITTDEVAAKLAERTSGLRGFRGADHRPVLLWGHTRLYPDTQTLVPGYGQDPIDLSGGQVTVVGNNIFFSREDVNGEQEPVRAIINGQLIITSPKIPHH